MQKLASFIVNFEAAYTLPVYVFRTAARGLFP
jgi:hypothetical protein